jgi:hypothetical protein
LLAVAGENVLISDVETELVIESIKDLLARDVGWISDWDEEAQGGE